MLPAEVTQAAMPWARAGIARVEELAL